MNSAFANKLLETIRIVPDFPKEGIQYFDITTVLAMPGMLSEITEVFCEHLSGVEIDAVAGIEARGFIFAANLAQRLNCSFVPIRKPGKLPHETEQVSYSLEYGEDSLEIHKDAVKAGAKVLLLDDLLATGGTAKACLSLLSKLEAEILGCGFVIELEALDGASALEPHQVFSILKAT